MNKNTYFITGGGTGGHIYPAVAVADELLSDKSCRIFYVGNPNNLEYEIVKQKDYVFLPVRSSGMPRCASLKIFPWIFQMFLAFLKCLFYILKYKPDAVFGTGGYVSAPVLAAAVITKTPFVMHDCDANPGLVTKHFAPYASSVSVAFEVEKSVLNNKNCFVNGNPIRQIFSVISKDEAKRSLNLDNSLTLCIMGGSQGARTINNASVEILKTLSLNYGLQIIFQTGKKNYDDVIERLKHIYPEYVNDKNIKIAPYFDNMPEVLKASDIAISRAGSLSISELCASQCVPIFVPYPYAAADHQRKNARYMVDNGCGLYIEDCDVSGESLLYLILTLLKDEDKLNNIRDNMKNFARYDSVKNITEQVKSSINR